MIQSTRISRTLWYDEPHGGRKALTQSDLLDRAEPMVILGEPGMGKTELLLWLKLQPGYAFCTARQLINTRPDPQKLLGDASVLVVDALDELSVRGDGDAVDAVLQKLGDVGYPRFVLACRVSDWRSATGAAAITEQYRGAPPLILHLEPLTEQEIYQILLVELDGNGQRAHDIVAHFDHLGLGGLLSNPQTLELVSRVAKHGSLPETKALLFDNAVHLLRREMNDAKVALQLDEASALDAAGAAFAALILTGSEALVVDSPEANEAELLAVEVAALPSASKLNVVIGSRLFGTTGSANRFRYWHRRIGEYLGARWLAQQASSAMRRRRILALFHAYGLVPSSLRGLHAWLAHHSPSLAPSVIAADVAAFIDYGEADSLSPVQARRLLDALKELAKRNPDFYLDGTSTAKALVQPELIEDIRLLIRDHNTAFYLMYLILMNVKGSVIAEPLRDELRSLMVDETVQYALRRLAYEALAQLGDENWSASLEQLRCASSDTEGLRLMLEIIGDVGVDAFGACSVIEFVLLKSQNQERVVGLLERLGGSFSDDSLDALLDELSRQIQAFSEAASNRLKMNGVLTDFAGHLISRRLRLGQIDPLQLWRWLSVINLRHGFERSVLDATNERLRDATELRRGIQRWVLLEEGGELSISQRAHRLDLACASLKPDEDDVLALLSALDPANRTDLRWRNILLLTQHSETKGERVRDAAKAFALHRPDLLSWIDHCGVERITKRRIKQARGKLRSQALRQLKYLENRRIYWAHIDELRQGEFSLVFNAAMVFLGDAASVSKDGTPLERLSAWLGQDIAEVAIQGFQAYLRSDDPPTAQQVGQSNAESERWDAGFVIVAAVLSRVLENRGFDDVSDDRLQAAYWLTQRFQDSSIGSELRPRLLEELRVRGQLDVAVQYWIEPQLELGRSHVNGLQQVLWNVLSEFSAAQLGLDWLSRFPDLPGAPESMIVDRLLSLSLSDELRPLVAMRLTKSLPTERRSSWDAVAFLIDFETHRDRLSQGGPEIRDLIWWLRRRVRIDRAPKITVPLSVEQMTCLIRVFRRIYPFVRRPEGQKASPWGTRTPGTLHSSLNR